MCAARVLENRRGLGAAQGAIFRVGREDTGALLVLSISVRPVADLILEYGGNTYEHYNAAGRTWCRRSMRRWTSNRTRHRSIIDRCFKSGRHNLGEEVRI